MRVNSEEALRRGREALDKAGSWMELRKTNAVRFASLTSRGGNEHVKPPTEHGSK